MSKSQVDEDGFTIVSKRFSKKNPTKIPPKLHKFVKEEQYIDITRAVRNIQSAVEELQSSDYLDHVIQSVSTVLQNKTVEELVCFGLGHIGSCHISRHQLALLQCLRDTLSPKKVFVHDPIFYQGECQVLEELGLEVIAENSEGAFEISTKGPTLVYLPHCPKQLTNNFLWSNWGPQLHNCILVCNSFSTLVETQPSRTLEKSVPLIFKIFPHTTEITLQNNFKYYDIFNDTSIHYFLKEKLDNIDKEFWHKPNKPDYQDTEEFITSQMVEKLNL